MIVDAQVHVWAPDTPERPWRRSADAHLPKPFGYEDLRGEMVRAGVDRAILIPPAWEGDRVDFVLEAAGKHPDRFAAMGRIPVDQPDSVALLPHWKRQPGMLGIRLSFQKEHNRHWMQDGTTDWFWPAAEQYGIPVMVFAPEWTAEIAAIAINHPKLTLIVDHMGLLREQDACAAAVIERTSALADCPNVPRARARRRAPRLAACPATARHRRRRTTGPGRRSLRWRESRTPAAARCPPRPDPRAWRLRHRPEEGLPEPSPPQAVRDDPAQHRQPHRPRADPPATTPAVGRWKPAAKFNPLFTHRVRITAATDLDDELRGWLATAYALAG